MGLVVGVMIGEVALGLAGVTVTVAVVGDGVDGVEVEVEVEVGVVEVAEGAVVGV